MRAAPHTGMNDNAIAPNGSQLTLPGEQAWRGGSRGGSTARTYPIGQPCTARTTTGSTCRQRVSTAQRTSLSLQNTKSRQNQVRRHCSQSHRSQQHGPLKTSPMQPRPRPPTSRKQQVTPPPPQQRSRTRASIAKSLTTVFQERILEVFGAANEHFAVVGTNVIRECVVGLCEVRCGSKQLHVVIISKRHDG
jgi:hypothetical protein